MPEEKKPLEEELKKLGIEPSLEELLKDLGKTDGLDSEKYFKPDKKEHVELDKIIDVYRKFLIESNKRKDPDWSKQFYNLGVSFIVSKETLYRFVSWLPKYESEELPKNIPTILFKDIKIALENFMYTGNFLSGLINNLESREDIEIDLTKITLPLSQLGFSLDSCNLSIKGNVGHGLGSNMKSGNIILEGNAGDSVGWFMQGGEIIINGNAGNYLGNNMKGGRITVKGNVGYKVGGAWFDETNNGEIYLYGKYKISNNVKGTRIYHVQEIHQE